MLLEKGYASDPVKTWKKSITVESPVDDESEAGSVISSESGPDFNYILNMNLWSLSKEKKEELLNERNKKVRINNQQLALCFFSSGMITRR